MKKKIISLMIGVLAVAASQSWGIVVEGTWPDLQVESPTGSYDQGTQRFQCGSPATGFTLFVDVNDAGDNSIYGAAMLTAYLDNQGLLLPNHQLDDHLNVRVVENGVSSSFDANVYDSRFTDSFGSLIYEFNFLVTAAKGPLGSRFSVGSIGYVNFVNNQYGPTMDIKGVPDTMATSCLLGLACVAMAFVRRLVAV